jgi:hypothetical protein
LRTPLPPLTPKEMEAVQFVLSAANMDPTIPLAALGSFDASTRGAVQTALHKLIGYKRLGPTR